MHILIMAPMQMQMKENMRMKRIRETIPKTEFESMSPGSA